MKLVKETTFILKVPLNGFYYKGLKVCTMEMTGLKCQAYSIKVFFQWWPLSILIISDQVEVAQKKYLLFIQSMAQIAYINGRRAK